MNNKFNIKLGALVDEKVLKTNIESFFSKNKFKIKLEVDSASVKAIQRATSGSGVVGAKSAKESADVFKAADKAAKAVANFNTKLINLKTTGGLTENQFNDFGKRLNAINEEFKNTGDIAAFTDSMHGLKNQVSQLSTANKAAGQSIVDIGKKFVTWISVSTVVMAVINTVRQLGKEVVALDAAMVELNKVSEETPAQLEKVKDKAFEIADALGRTGEEVLNATTEFKRMGYSMDESLDLAAVAIKMTNVAEGITDAGDAANTLTSILKGTNTEVKYASSLLDRLNEVSNNNAVSFDALSAMLQESAATMDILGNNIDQTIGLLTGAYSVLQDESVANGIQTIGLRIAGLNEDMEAQAGLSNEVVEALQKYAGINAFDEQSGQLKNTYSILEELAGVWDTIDKNQQSALLNTLAGKRQADVAAAILNNWEGVSKAVQDAANSMGSADKEQQAYLDSIEGRINRVKNLFQQFADQIIGSDLIKTFIEFFESLVKIAGPLLNFVSLLIEIGGLTTSLKMVSNVLNLLGEALLVVNDGIEVFKEGLQPVLDWIEKYLGLGKLLDKDSPINNDDLDLGDTYKDAQRELSDYEKELKKFNKTMADFIAQRENELSQLKAEQKALEREHELKEKVLDIDKKRLAFEEARQRKVRVYRAGVGFIYQEDTAAVQSAIDDLEEAINSLAEYRYEIAIQRAEEFLSELNTLLSDENTTLEGWNSFFNNFSDLADTQFSDYLTKTKQFVENFNKETEGMNKILSSEIATDNSQGGGGAHGKAFQLGDGGREHSKPKSSASEFFVTKGADQALFGGTPVVQTLNGIKNLWDWVKSKIKKNASGTENFSGGDTWVGEHGPELVRLPKGTEILSHNRSMKLHSIVNNPSAYVGNTNKSTTLQFSGDLNFPNVRDGSDAHEFVDALVKIGNSSIPKLN